MTLPLDLFNRFWYALAALVVILREGLSTFMMVLIGEFAAGPISQMHQALRIAGLTVTPIWLLGLAVLLPSVIKKENTEKSK